MRSTCPRMRHRSASPPVRSVTSSTVVQKHVGHTIVQLPHVRQRSATSSQRGCSSESCSSSRSPWVSSSRPMRSGGALDDRRVWPFDFGVVGGASAERPRALPLRARCRRERGSGARRRAAPSRRGRSPPRRRARCPSRRRSRSRRDLRSRLRRRRRLRGERRSPCRRTIPSSSTRSWIAIACRSQPRTPKNA